VEDRRRAIRRQADRDLFDRVHYLESLVQQEDGPDREEVRRKRRHAVRHNCQVSIKMLVGHSAGTSDLVNIDHVSVKGRLLDLSTDGALLFTKEPFGTGQELQLEMRLDKKRELQCGALVRWVKAVPEKDGFASGVRLVEVPARAQQQLDHFLEKLAQSLGL